MLNLTLIVKSKIIGFSVKLQYSKKNPSTSFLMAGFVTENDLKKAKQTRQFIAGNCFMFCLFATLDYPIFDGKID